MNSINKTLIKTLIVFIYFFAKSIALAKGVADNLEALIIPTITKLNQEDDTTYPNTSAYKLSQGSSSDFVITKYLSSEGSDGETTYTPLSFELSIYDISLDSTGENYLYYTWDYSSGNRVLSLLDSENAESADFYVRYDSSTSYVSSSLRTNGGVLYYYKKTIDSISSDFIANYASSNSSKAYGGAIYTYNSIIDSIDAAFIGNYAQSLSTYYTSYVYGGAIYNNYYTEIGSITGDFVANYVSSYANVFGGAIYNDTHIEIDSITGNFIANYAYSSSSAYAGAIYNYYYSDIYSITGDFIGNYASSSYSAYAGAIYNYAYSVIGSITGDFIGNYVFSEKSSVCGGAIYNYYDSEITSIVGDFYGNYAKSEATSAIGGAIYNREDSIIGSITGDFVGNYVYGYTGAYGGAIYNYYRSQIGDINGSFYGNYAFSQNSSACGGAIYGASNLIESITGDFYANYAEGVSAKGGAIYNAYDIYYIEGDFYGNYAKASSSEALGGAIYNYSYQGILTEIKSNFISNYAYSAQSYALGGALYHNNYAVLDKFTGDFYSNYASSGASYAYGGAIYNNSFSEIISMSANFYGNYALAYTEALGGAIYNDNGALIEYLSGDFVGNYASSSTSEALGGAIYNVGLAYSYLVDDPPATISTINIENASFVDNSVSGTSAYGGAIYNDATIKYTLTEDSYAVATGNTASTLGGFLYNTGDISFNIEAGAYFTVGTYLEDDSTDSIYNDGSFVKTGAGTMLIRSNFINEAYDNSDTDSILGGSISVFEGVLIVEGTDEAEDLDAVWFNSDAVLNAISGASASFVLGTSMNLGEYLIVGTYEGDALENTAYFGADSVFAVHVETTGGSGDYDSTSLSSALVGDGNSTVIIESGAILVVYGASADTDIRILEDFDGASSAYSAWEVESISSANPLYEINTVEWRTEESAVADIPAVIDIPAVADIPASGDEDLSLIQADESLSVDTPSIATFSLSLLSLEDDESNTASTLSNTSTDSATNTLLAIDDTSSDAVAAIDDTSTASDSLTSLYISSSVDEEVVEEVGQIAEIGGVASNMGFILNLARDTTMARFSVFDENFKSEYETNFGVWATPMYNYTEARGLNAGIKSTGYDMYLGGGNIGVDYTFAESYRLGIAFHGGYGETNSVGDFSQTGNDFSFYSLSLYNGLKVGKFLIYADINFAMTDNDLTQYNSLGTGNFYADLAAYAISGELRIEYLFKVANFNIIPHLGLSYMYLSINDYDVTFSGESALYVDSKGQSIFTIPIGLSFSTGFDLGNDCTLSPILDLGVIFALGDLYSESTASFTDIFPTNLSVQAYNDYTFSGLLGLELKKNNTRVGLSYFIEASENIISHNFRLNYRYNF